MVEHHLPKITYISLIRTVLS